MPHQNLQWLNTKLEALVSFYKNLSSTCLHINNNTWGVKLSEVPSELPQGAARHITRRTVRDHNISESVATTAPDKNMVGQLIFDGSTSLSRLGWRKKIRQDMSKRRMPQSVLKSL